MCEFLHGGVDLLLDRLNQFGALLVKLTFCTEVLHLQVLGFLFLVDDGLLAGAFLVFGKEQHLGLVFAVHLRHLVVNGLHLFLPFGRKGVQLFLCVAVFRNVFHDVLRVDIDDLLSAAKLCIGSHDAATNQGSGKD